MNLMNNRTKLLAAIACAGALAGCNAVETFDEPPVIANPLTKVLLEGTVSGLSSARPVELSVLTTNNGIAATQVVPTRGSTLLRLGSADQGAAYQVTVFKNPYGRTCTVTNGSGTANADVNNITVTCVRDNAPQYTLTVGIASQLSSAPPAGFRVTLTTEEGTETIVPATGQTAVTFALPLLYPPSTTRPGFTYTVTATNTVGGTTNSCAVNASTATLQQPTTPANVVGTPTTGIRVTGCAYTVSASVQYSSTPACNSSGAVVPAVNCAPAIPAGSASVVGAGGVQLQLRNQLTNADVLATPLTVNAFSATPVLLSSATYTAGPNSLYEVYVKTQPTGQFCIVQDGGTVNLVTVSSLADHVVQVRCRDIPVTANQLKGVYQLEAATVNPATGVPVPAPRLQLRNFLTFFPNGTFLYGSHPAGASGTTGVEHGFYNYSSANGTLQFTLVTDRNGTAANNFDSGFSGRAGFAGGSVTALNVVRTAGSASVPGRLSLTFGAVNAVAANGALYFAPTWTFAEPRQSPGKINGAWATADSKRVFVFDDVTFYGFHAGVNGAANVQDACFTIVNADIASSFYTRRGGDVGCMGTALAAAITTNGTVSVATVDVAASSINGVPSTPPGVFEGRIPGSASTLVLSPSPTRYTVTPGNPDTLLIQGTLNDIPTGAPVLFQRHTTY